MNIHRTPDPIEKLALVGDANRFEPVGDRPQAERKPSAAPLHFVDEPQIPRSAADIRPCITHVSTPQGKKPILKAMMTTACERNCYYCPFRAGRGEMRRVTFKPDEMAKTFHQLEQAQLVDGLFLSSGIINGGVTAQDKIIDTVEILRRRYGYQGYIHLKIMPGAEYDQILRAMQLADRVSINLEGPTAQRLDRLAPMKNYYDELLQRLRWAHEIRRQAWAEAPGLIRASIVTQFVVGAVGDTDVELLSLTGNLHRLGGLDRAYFSAFNPVSGTPFENLPPTPAIRERRLYQASYLLRDYGWDVEDLPFEPGGNLRTDTDPKTAWADLHLRERPIDVMRATREELLRVPGIGPVGADAILKARRQGRLSDLSHLRKIGLRGVERAAPYILLDGRRPPQQLSLFGVG
ncbi:MAG TPA: radical SAM protein [Aggregatilineales bacterium]|nr:radical SAM protein [Aggregatilineales bacterium]